jgi:uncharacterized protein YbaR (Trm112 family)
MDRKLLDILCCPASKQPLALLNKAELRSLNEAIAAGGSSAWTAARSRRR